MKHLNVILITALLAGCTSIHKTQTLQEQNTGEWNQARASVYFNLAKQQYDASDLEKSRQSVDQALALEPKDVTFLLLSAKLWIEEGQLESAERQLDLARIADPKNAEADYLSGIVFQRWQMPALALTHYSAACDKAPAELAYLMARAETLVTLDRSPEALVLLQSKAQYFEHSAALLDALGQLFVDASRYPEAIDAFRQASLLADGDSAIRERLGLAMYYAKQYRDAADVLGSLVILPEFASHADLFMAIGDCQMRLGKSHDAMNSFQSAGQVEPNSVAIWLKTAEAALQLGDLHWAQIATNKAIALDEKNARAELMLGYLRLRQNRLADALSAFIAANQLDPQDSLSVTMTGYIYEKRGMKKEATQCYAKALQLHPGDELAERLMQKMHG
jgi:Flp pilus assembly protein TadD